MARGPLVAVGAAALAGAGFLLAAVPLGARTGALPTGNLVQNPGFEEGTGSADGHFVAALPRWRRPDASAGFTAVRYGATGGFPGLGVRDDVGGQTNFAAGGPRDNEKEVDLEQQVDLSTWAAEIDRGGVQARISAYIGGYQNDADSGQVTIELYGAENDQGWTPYYGGDDLGPVTRSDRGGVTKLLRRTTTLAVHTGTRRLKLRLRAFPSGGDYTNVFFDNVSVELFSGTPPPTTGTTTAPTTTTRPSTTTGTTSQTTTTSPPKPPAPKPVLSLACARRRLVATVKPAKGSRVLSVGFSVNGKARTTDRTAPFVLSLSTKGLRAPVHVTAVVHFAKSKTTLRRQHGRC
jgi:hypothetical protein